MRKLILTISLGILGLTMPAGAAAAPIFKLDIHHAPSNFAPGGDQTEAAINITTPVEGSSVSNEQQQIIPKANTGTVKLDFRPRRRWPNSRRSTNRGYPHRIKRRECQSCPGGPSIDWGGRCDGNVNA